LVALSVLAGVALVALATVSPAMAVAVAAAVPAIGPLRRRARAQAERRSLVGAAPAALDLCTVVLGAGGTIPDALTALATVGPTPIRQAAAEARARAAAGHQLDQALRWLQAELGPGLQPLTGALLLAHEQGGSIALTLARLAGEASAGRRRQGEVQARQLPVLLLAPLILCALPAVLLGAVVPLAVVALRRVEL
jgi:tight adherence protein C